MDKIKIIEEFELLLDEAMYLYQYYPNNFRATAEDYFKDDIEFLKQLKGE